MPAGVAQLAAHPTCNRAVPGSSPGVGSKKPQVRPLLGGGWGQDPGRAEDAGQIEAQGSQIAHLRATPPTVALALPSEAGPVSKNLS